MALQLVEPVGNGHAGGGGLGRRGSRSGSKTSLEKTGRQTPERMSNEPDDPDEDNQWMPDHDPRDDRGEFATRAQFLLTVIGFALGNGNYWHFPLAVRRFGGASFILMYFICMAVFGVPMLYLEMMIGQIAQCGPMRAFQLHFPLLQGVGWAVCTLSFLRAVNFSLLNAYSLEYAVESLIGLNHRTACTSEWNSLECFSPATNAKKCEAPNVTHHRVYWKNKCISLEDRLKQEPAIEIPSREYFRHHLRGLPTRFADGIANESEFTFGSGTVIAAFCCVWLFAGFCLLRRMRWVGKMSLFIVSAAGVLTIIFTIKSLTLARAEVAIARQFKFDAKMFTDRDAWLYAIRWTRDTLCIGVGGMLSMSSYNKRSNDAFQDAIIVTVVVALVSVSTGLNFMILFSFLRSIFPFVNWARIEKYNTAFMLYFIYFPELLATFAFPALWSFMFFSTILGLGITTFFGLLETPISALTDQFKICRKHRSITIVLLTLLGLGLGVVQCSRVGYHIFYILDVRILPLIAEIMTGFQLLTIVFYGPRNFYRDISASIGKKVNSFGNFVSPYGLVIRLCQFVINPCMLGFIVIMFHKDIFQMVWKRKEQTLERVPNIPRILASSSLLPWPIIIGGAIAAFVANKKAGKSWIELLHPHHMHPANRYKVPPPLGWIFGVKPIEAMPSAMGDDKVVEFPEKATAPAPKKEEALLEL